MKRAEQAQERGVNDKIRQMSTQTHLDQNLKIFFRSNSNKLRQWKVLFGVMFSRTS